MEEGAGLLWQPGRGREEVRETQEEGSEGGPG